MTDTKPSPTDATELSDRVPTATGTDGHGRPLRVLVVDDEAPARRIAVKLLNRYCEGVSEVVAAPDIPTAVEALGTHRPDLVLLDIDLREGSGFDLTEHIDPTRTQVVFVTAYPQYAVDAFRVAATDYLVKPIRVTRLQEAVRRVRERRVRETDRKITLPGVSNRRVLGHDEILYATAEGSYSTITLAGEEIFVVRKLGVIETDLNSPDFFRCHRSHLIHLRQVTGMHPGGVTMSDGKQLSVSRGRRAELVAALKGLA